MKSATADTNIYISAFEFGGMPRRFLELAASGAFRLDISTALLLEIKRVLRVKFQWSEVELYDIGEDILSYAHSVAPVETLDIIKADPSDNRILECALAAKSDFIVSGDVRHVLSLETFAGISIVKVADFLEVLKRENPS